MISVPGHFENTVVDHAASHAVVVSHQTVLKAVREVLGRLHSHMILVL